MQRQRPAGQYRINGTKYISLDEVAREVEISRTTLWRWRQGGKVPLGHRYRGRLTLFTLEERDAIRDYANRLAPIGPTSAAAGRPVPEKTEVLSWPTPRP
jgi:hypothetical protein